MVSLKCKKGEYCLKKHIPCRGNSNTHGDCVAGGIRFDKEERWICLLQKKLGDAYLVTEEGLSGCITVFVDPLHESMNALIVDYPILKSHGFIDLLIIMPGTNASPKL